MKKAIRFFINLLLEKDIVRFSTIENSFFLYKKLDKKIKIDKNIINLNYKKESPYSNDKTTIVSIANNDNLYLWFIKGDYYNYIPEAYILYRKLLLDYTDIIFIIKGEIDKVIVIKDSILVSSFSKSKISRNDIILLQDEFNLNKIVEIKEAEYQQYIKDAIEYLKFSDLLYILNIKFDFKDSAIKAVQFLALPVFISSIVITIAVASYYFYIEKEKDRLYNLYKKDQKLNYKIKTKIENNQEKDIIYQNLSKEFRYIDKSIALSEILKKTDDMNMSLNYIKIYENHVNYTIKAKNDNIIPIYVKELFESNLFEDIKNTNSRKIKDYIEVTMSGKLKEI